MKKHKRTMENYLPTNFSHWKPAQWLHIKEIHDIVGGHENSWCFWLITKVPKLTPSCNYHITSIYLFH